METSTFRYYILCTILGIILGEGHAICMMSHEKCLIKHLLDNYDIIGTLGRPVYNSSETVRVQMGLALVKLQDLNEYNQVLSTHTWLRYMWTDITLRWNPADFGGVDHIRLPITKIWSPDIFLYNSVQHDNHYTSNLNDGGALAVVSSNGDVLWIPRMNLQSTCSIDFTYFPWDTQVCQLKFGSWTYDGFKVDVNFYGDSDKVDLSDYIVSNEWQILDAPAKKNIKYYPCCAEPYPDLVFTIRMRRMSSGNQLALVLPTALLTILTVLIFYIPPVMDAKINLGMLVFLGYFGLLLKVNSLAPFGGITSSRLVTFLSAGICLVTIVLILSVLTMNLARIGKRGVQLPRMLKAIFNNFLGCIFCVCSSGRVTGNDEGLISPLDESEKDWETFATVLDRIFFAFVSALILILAIAIR